MKYGIVTFHNIPNIGALLQAYSLCMVIRSMGYDCEIIDYECDNIVKRELCYHPHPNPLKDLVLRLFWHKSKKKIKLCQEYMRSKHLYSLQSYDKRNIIESNKIYDSFISGSDMIWNLEVTGYDYNYFLEFVDEGKEMFSYGSSIGCKWKDADVVTIKRLLSRYCKIAVREVDTCSFIRTMGLECKHVVDPTMLISAEHWQNESVKPRYNKYVLLYFSSNELLASARKYAKIHNLSIVYITPEFPIPFVTNVSPNTPPEWIGYFKNADAVFTNSYHGLLFSLYFKKPVWTANYGNRIISLLKTLGLENRLLKNDIELSSSIGYEMIETKINELREASLAYISSILKK